MKQTKRVAIIGMGIAGSAVLEAYAKESKRRPDLPLHLACYDESRSWGRGLAYLKDAPEVLLNTRAETVAYDYEQRGHYATWLKETKGLEEAYTSRGLFGEYLNHFTKQTAADLNATMIPEKVQSLTYLPDRQQWLINSETLPYDHIHLCTGLDTMADPYNLQGQAHYIHTPYPLQTSLSHIPAGQTIGILGTNLTAIDIAKVALKQLTPRKIWLASRHGNLPVADVEQLASLPIQVLTFERLREIREENQGVLPFEALDALIEEEFRCQAVYFPIYRQERLLPGWEALAVSLENPPRVARAELLAMYITRLLNTNWAYMTRSDQSTFWKKYHRTLDLTRSKIPLASVTALLEGKESGVLDIMGGLTDVAPASDEGGFLLKSNNNNQSLKVDYLINGIGLSNNPHEANDPLIQQLLADSLIASHPFGGIIINSQNGQIISPIYGSLPTAQAHGSIIEGSIYQANATYIIQERAHHFVRKSLAHS